MLFTIRTSTALAGAATTFLVGNYVSNARKHSHMISQVNGNRYVPVERSGGGI